MKKRTSNLIITACVAVVVAAVLGGRVCRQAYSGAPAGRAGIYSNPAAQAEESANSRKLMYYDENLRFRRWTRAI